MKPVENWVRNWFSLIVSWKENIREQQGWWLLRCSFNCTKNWRVKWMAEWWRTSVHSHGTRVRYQHYSVLHHKSFELRDWSCFNNCCWVLYVSISIIRKSGLSIRTPFDRKHKSIFLRSGDRCRRFRRSRFPSVHRW